MFYFNDLNTRKVVRLAKERLSYLRILAIQYIIAWKSLKALLASRLRRTTYLRDLLNLPVSNPIAWHEWLKCKPLDGFEVPIDSGGHVSLPLPEGFPLEMKWFFQKESTCWLESSFLAGIKDGSVWNHHGGVYFSRDRELLRGLGREHWLDDLAKVPAAMQQLRFPHAQYLNGTVAVLASPDAFSNFGHWCLDVLPKIGLLERSGWDIDSIDYFLIGHSDKAYQFDSLEKLGVPKEKILSMESYPFIQATTLLVPFLNSYHFTSFQPSSLSFLRKSFLPDHRNSESISRKFPKRVFISRADASFRRVVNEDEIRLVLEPLGFDFVTLSGLNLAQTAELMSCSEIIISPNGSGLISAIFAMPSAFVLEFSHARYTTSFHWKFCFAAGMRYAHLVSDDEPVLVGSEQRLLYADLSINPSRLIKALNDADVL